ncbi:MAG: hypothetical protein JWR07_1829 [Nevskia sp.]|nr:hypothetical protein [Nevskia sp.]
MAFLGIDPDGVLMAEGPTHGGRILWPHPIVTLATLIHSDLDLQKIEIEANLYAAPLLFREEYFDPVTRIRRGRLYRNQGNQPSMWNGVQGHPGGQIQQLNLCTYQAAQWRDLEGDRPISRTRIALGTRNAFGLWSVVMVERTTGRTDLITLRTQSTFGLLPSAEELDVPADARGEIQRAIDGAVNAAHHQLSDATVDACRHAAVAALGTWRLAAASVGAEYHDLGKLVSIIEKLSDSPSVIVNCGRILARLHSRTKPNERKLRDLRRNEDADGEAAIAVLGLLLRELRPSPLP